MNPVSSSVKKKTELTWLQPITSGGQKRALPSQKPGRFEDHIVSLVNHSLLAFSLIPFRVCCPQVTSSLRQMVTIQIFNKDKNAQYRCWGRGGGHNMTAVQRSRVARHSLEIEALHLHVLSYCIDPLKEPQGPAALPPPAASAPH